MAVNKNSAVDWHRSLNIFLRFSCGFIWGKNLFDLLWFQIVVSKWILSDKIVYSLDELEWFFNSIHHSAAGFTDFNASMSSQKLKV